MSFGLFGIQVEKNRAAEMAKAAAAAEMPAIPSPAPTPAPTHPTTTAEAPVAPIQTPTQEKPMSTTPIPVAAAPTTAAKSKTTPLSFIKHLGSLFAHGVQKAIALVQKAAPPIENIALVAGTLAGVGPEVQAAEDTFNLMFGEVVQVEQVATAVGASEGTGVQKLNAAIPQVEQIILSNPLFKGKTITDLTKWNQAIASITGSLYDLGNSVATPAATTPTTPTAPTT